MSKSVARRRKSSANTAQPPTATERRKRLVGVLSGRIKSPDKPPERKGKGRGKKKKDAWDISELERISADPSMISDKLALKIMNVNASQAQAWLQSAARNRKLDGRIVAKYAAQMIRGDWNSEQPEPLVFSKQGQLIQGQSRLAAVMKAAETEGEQFSIRFAILVGANRESQFVMDTGKPRTIAQTAQIKGIDASPFEIAITNALWISPDPKKARIPRSKDTPKVLATFDQFKDGIKLAAVKNAGRNSISNAMIRSVIVRAYYYYCTKEGSDNLRTDEECIDNKELLERFVYVLDTGLPEGTDEHTPAILRRDYQATPPRLKRTKLELYRKTIYALKAYMEGTEVKRLKQCNKQEFPLIGFSGDQDEE